MPSVANVTVCCMLKDVVKYEASLVNVPPDPISS